MSPTAADISEKLLLNRHSCEGTFGRKSTKLNMDIYHRSIQSDPGVCFDLIKQTIEGGYVTNPYAMKKKLPVTDLRSVVLRRRDSGVRDLHPGQNNFFHSMFKYWHDEVEGKLPIDRILLRDVRRSGAANGRVISTSLSSSAASLYSEDEHIRSSRNSSPAPSYASECPSLPSRSARHSFSCIDEEDTDPQMNENLTKLQENIDNNNINDDIIAKIEESYTHFNLNNNCQEDKSNVALATANSAKVGNGLRLPVIPGNNMTASSSRKVRTLVLSAGLKVWSLFFECISSLSRLLIFYELIYLSS